MKLTNEQFNQLWDLPYLEEESIKVTLQLHSIDEGNDLYTFSVPFGGKHNAALEGYSEMEVNIIPSEESAEMFSDLQPIDSSNFNEDSCDTIDLIELKDLDFLYFEARHLFVYDAKGNPIGDHSKNPIIIKEFEIDFEIDSPILKIYRLSNEKGLMFEKA